MICSLSCAISRQNKIFEDQNIRLREGVELGKTMMLEKILCRQKSKALWLKEGNRNTKCFHCIAKAH